MIQQSINEFRIDGLLAEQNLLKLQKNDGYSLKIDYMSDYTSLKAKKILDLPAVIFMSDKEAFKNISISDFREFLENNIGVRYQKKIRISTGELVGRELLSTFNDNLERGLKIYKNRTYLDNFMLLVDEMPDDYGKALIDHILLMGDKDSIYGLPTSINVPRRLLRYAGDEIKKRYMDSKIAIEALETGGISGNGGKLEASFEDDVRYVVERGNKVHLDDGGAKGGVYDLDTIVAYGKKNKVSLGDEKVNLIEMAKWDAKFTWGILAGILVKVGLLNDDTPHYKRNKEQRMKLSNLTENDLTDEAIHLRKTYKAIRLSGLDNCCEGIEYDEMIHAMTFIFESDYYIGQGYKWDPPKKESY